MSIGIFNKKLQDIKPEIVIPEVTYNNSNLAIPFSIMFKKNSSSDIYSGEENITFNERHFRFKEILINEFVKDQ